MTSPNNLTHQEAPSHSPDPERTTEPEIIDDNGITAKQRVVAIVGLSLLATFTFFVGLGEIALLGPDEPRYAEVGREMLVSGDYITPRLCGCLWFEKPVLLYWGAAAAYSLFGVGEFGARFPSALAATLTAIFLACWLWRTGSPRFGMLVAMVLTTTALFIGYARAATTDMLLAATITVAVLSGYSIINTNMARTRLIYAALCGVATGLSVLAKGLVGVVLVGAILLTFLVLVGRLRSLGWREFLAGLTAFLIVAAAWYLPVTVEHGWDFLDQFFIDHHIRRYVSNRFYHPQPLYFYPVVNLMGAIPWSFFVIPALVRAFSLRLRRRREDHLLILAWVWVVVPTIFFSFSGSKLPGYILPVFPAIALIVGHELEQVWRGEWTRSLKAAMWGTGLMLIAVSIGLVAYLRRVFDAEFGWTSPLLWAPLLVGLLSIIALACSKKRTFLIAGVVMVPVVVAATVIHLFPRVNDQWSRRSLSLQSAAALQPGEKIAFFIYKEFAPVFYAEGRVACGYGEGDVLNALHQDKLVSALERESSLIIITLQRWHDDLEEDSRFVLEYLGSQGEVLAFRVRLRDEGPVSQLAIGE